MLILLYIICCVLFLTTLGLLVSRARHSPSLQESWRTIKTGLVCALRDCGLTVPRRRMPIELYRWEIMDTENACDECRQRCQWTPMDIADWMEAGMPDEIEREQDCPCRQPCRLVRCHLKKYSSPKPLSE